MVLLIKFIHMYFSYDCDFVTIIEYTYNICVNYELSVAQMVSGTSPPRIQVLDLELVLTFF